MKIHEIVLNLENSLKVSEEKLKKALISNTETVRDLNQKLSDYENQNKSLEDQISLIQENLLESQHENEILLKKINELGIYF